MLENILFMLVLFVTNTVQTITGFAGNLLAMPASVQLVGYESAGTVLNVFTMVVCSWLAIRNRRYVRWKILLKMCLMMIIGMGIGIYLLTNVNTEILFYLYGIMIMVIGIKKLLVKREIPVPEKFMVLVLLMAGIVHGIFVSGGALLVIYAVGAIPDKNEFRATVAPVWVFLGIILVLNHIRTGYYTRENLVLIAASFIPLVLSVRLGNVLYDKINGELFLKIVYILFIISGVLVFI